MQSLALKESISSHKNKNPLKILNKKPIANNRINTVQNHHTKAQEAKENEKHKGKCHATGAALAIESARKPPISTRGSAAQAPYFVSSVFAPHSLSLLRAPQQHNHSSTAPCPACRALEIEAMQDFTELSFAEAFPLWYEAHKPYISKRSIKDYWHYGQALTAFFDRLQIKNIGKGQVRSYQMWRSSDPEHFLESVREPESKYHHSASGVRIRSEINCVLKPILREAGQWVKITEQKFNHLPVPREGSGTPLTIEEQNIVLAVGFTKKKWHLATHCQRVMYRTGTLFGELRKMRRKHLDLRRGTVTILEGAKNHERERTVALVPSALESMAWILARFEKHGGLAPDQFLLYHRKKGLYVPMESTYRSFRAIIDATIEKNKGNSELIAKLEKTRQCDGRTSAACLLLQNEKLSLPVIEKALGWTPNSHMRKRYHKAAQNIQLDALMTLEGQ